MNKAILICCLCCAFFSCNTQKKDKAEPGNARAIIVQPFGDFPAARSQQVFEQLKKINPNIVLKESIELPAVAYYVPRNRYRADILINYLKDFGSKDSVVIGLTDKDISTTKDNIKDWGVMGLGFRPGNACVVSSFRLSKLNLADQFYKVAIHELGHTSGLPHCENKKCFMRDADGKNPVNEEEYFCAYCKAYLRNRGWKLL